MLIHSSFRGTTFAPTDNDLRRNQMYIRCRQRNRPEDTCADKLPGDRVIYEWQVNAILYLAEEIVIVLG